MPMLKVPEITVTCSIAGCECAGILKSAGSFRAPRGALTRKPITAAFGRVHGAETGAAAGFARIGRRLSLWFDQLVAGLARAVQEPDIVLRVDGEARLITELELRLLRPRRVNLEHWNVARLRLRRLRSRLGREKPCGRHASSGEVRHQTNETESPTLHDFLLSDPTFAPRRETAGSAAAPRGQMQKSTAGFMAFSPPAGAP